jgi:pyridoxamine 5'-phosphate oxidase
MYLTKDNINKDPIKQFSLWLDDAKKLDLKDPDAMNLASSTKDGVPSSRMLILKSFDKKGFVFYTNYDSRKSNEILQNPLVALNFFWDALGRQVRVEGKIEKADKVISDKYFNSRARLSQLSAHASKQSQTIETYKVLKKRLDDTEKNFKDKEIPRPENWGGFIVIPSSIEFWQGHKGRLHDRLKFIKEDSGWVINRLSP